MSEHSSPKKQYSKSLKLVKYSMPLFPVCYKAYPFSSPNSTKYLMIPDLKVLTNKPISKYLCPSFSPPEQNKTYILLEGQCLADYLQAKRNSNVLMTEEDIWALAYSLIQSFIVIKSISNPQKGIKHLKEYMVQKIDAKHYKLIYHEGMRSQLEAANLQKYRWSHFYLSPQELRGSFVNEKSIVFSLGAMLLNICTYSDSMRTLYRDDTYQVSWKVLGQKIKLCRQFYSNELTLFIEHCLQENHEDRYDFQALRCFFMRKMDRVFKKQSDLLTQILSVDPSSRSIEYDINMSAPYDCSIYSSYKGSNLQHQSKSHNSRVTPTNKQAQMHRNKGKKKFQKVPKSEDKQLIEKKHVQSVYVEQISLQQQRKPQKQEQEEQHQRYSPTRIGESSTIQYRGTFGDRTPFHQNDSVQPHYERYQGWSNESEIIELPSVISNGQNFSNLKINTSYQQYLITDKQQGEKEIEHYSNTGQADTPRGFGHFEFNTAFFVKNSVETQKMNTEQLLNSESERQYSQRIAQQQTISQTFSSEYIPEPLKKIGNLELKTCLAPIQELQKSIGKIGVWIQGDIYFGEFINGHRNGRGLELFPNGEYYFGNFQNDLFHGPGFYYWNSKQYFLGEFRYGQKYSGHLYGPVSYQGTFEQSRRHGRGTCWYSNGQIYVGEWFQGKRHGKGVLISLNSRFQGTWSKGKKNGEGIYQIQGITIEGIWKGEKLLGEALIKYGEGSQFRGIVNENLQKMEGIYVSKSGNRYEGKYHNDEPSQGTMYYKNKDQYSGTFLNNKRHGRGHYLYANGEKYVGEWEQDKRVTN